MNFLLWSLLRACLSIIYSFIFFVRKYLGIFFSVFGKAISPSICKFKVFRNWVFQKQTSFIRFQNTNTQVSTWVLRKMPCLPNVS